MKKVVTTMLALTMLTIACKKTDEAPVQNCFKINGLVGHDSIYIQPNVWLQLYLYKATLNGKDTTMLDVVNYPIDTTICR